MTKSNRHSQHFFVNQLDYSDQLLEKRFLHLVLWILLICDSLGSTVSPSGTTSTLFINTYIYVFYVYMHRHVCMYTHIQCILLHAFCMILGNFRIIRFLGTFFKQFWWYWFLLPLLLLFWPLPLLEAPFLFPIPWWLSCALACLHVFAHLATALILLHFLFLLSLLLRCIVSFICHNNPSHQILSYNNHLFCAVDILEVSEI